MPAIGLRAFHEMFAHARSMALVGNAETILEHASGERIDGCDLVVRFNRAHVAGIEDKVGRRTDILVANRNYNLRKAPSPAETLQPALRRLLPRAAAGHRLRLVRGMGAAICRH